MTPNKNNSKLITDFEFQHIEISKNLIFAKKNNKYALLNSKGKALSAFKYDEILTASKDEGLDFLDKFGVITDKYKGSIEHATEMN